MTSFLHSHIERITRHLYDIVKRIDKPLAAKAALMQI